MSAAYHIFFFLQGMYIIIKLVIDFYFATFAFPRFNFANVISCHKLKKSHMIFVDFHDVDL